MQLADKKHCCGCGACSTVCPFGAIKMEYNQENFIYPVVDEELCKDCGKCESICPILNKNKISISSHNLRVIQGYYATVEKQKASASGGAATAFSEYIIDKDGCVFGSSYTDDYKDAIYIKVERKEDLYKLKGSKYIETRKNDIYKEVLKEINTGRLVLFTGLPCDIGALKCYLNKEYDNLYTCELICHGPTSVQVQRDYINDLSNKYKSKVINFSSRYNEEGIEAPYIKVDFENGKSYKKPLWDTEYGYAFAVYSRESCYNCSFKGDNRVADVSIGDSWCAGELFGDKKGVSIIYAHTNKGMELINWVQNTEEFISENLEYEKVKDDNPAIRESLCKKPERDRFALLLVKKGLKKATWRTKNPKEKLKYIIKLICKR